MSTRSLAPTWTELSQLGVVLLSFLGGALLPESFRKGITQPWPVHFVIAVTTGLLIVAGRRRRSVRDTRLWVSAALGTLGVALIGLFVHYFLAEIWTCRYYDRFLVIGSSSDLASVASEYIEGNGDSCEELLKAFIGKQSAIWEGLSVALREVILTLTYLFVSTLFAACAIATIQAVSCSRRGSEN
jgi:4-amino-4-deoxy-L-arabinose transferase-like glycosyltransferase